jgi:hypothetical protein
MRKGTPRDARRPCRARTTRVFFIPGPFTGSNALVGSQDEFFDELTRPREH